MKAIVATDQAAEAAGITLTERPEPTPAINDVVVEVHASGFVPAEWEWPSTWVDRCGHDRAPAIIGHEFAGVVSSLGYGTTGLSLGQRVFGITDWHRDGTLAEYAAVEARNLAPLPGNVDFTANTEDSLHVTLTPTAVLDENTLYTIEFAGIEDLAGNEMATEELKFTTTDLAD